MSQDPTIRTSVDVGVGATVGPVDSSHAATVISGLAAATPSAGAPAPPVPDVAIDRELGRGGMGVVYLGRQTYLDRQVAVKVLLLSQADRAGDYVKRFQREARILAGLAHPHIVACYSAGVTPDGNPYLVMEFIDGPDLRKWINTNGHLGERDAVRLIRDLALGLEHAHAQGIIHRDVKPENVLLAKAADGSFPFVAKLVDLGLARPAVAQGEHALTVEGQVMGTPATMAPEQFERPEAVDHRADIYGLGCVLFHALAGKPAFSAPTIAAIVHDKVAGATPDPSSVRPDLGRPVAALVRDLLARDPAARPQTYRDLIDRCNAILDGSARAPRPPWLFAAVAGGIVLALGVIALAYTPKAPAAAPASSAPTQPAPVPAAPTPTVAQATSTPGATSQPAVASREPVPAAPTIPQRSASEELLGFGISDRLTGWTVSPGARWSASEERENVRSITGLSGWISRTVGPPPWRLTAVLHLTNQPRAKTDVVNLGVIQADGSTISLTVKNLGDNWLGAVETAPLPGADPTTLKGPAAMPPTADLPVELHVTADGMTVHVGSSILGPIPVRITGTKIFAAVTNQPADTTAGDLVIRPGPCDFSQIVIHR
jgi:serine/threonine protein kinase